MLHYTVVQVDIEPPDATGKCLDFLRMFYCQARFYVIIIKLLIITGLNFNTTGISTTSDLCGSYEKLPDETCGDTCGFHGSKLTLDFRSNRIYSRGDLNLGFVCIPSSATAQKIIPGYKNGYSVRGCSPRLSSRARKSTDRPTTAKEFFVRHSFEINTQSGVPIYIFGPFH